MDIQSALQDFIVAVKADGLSPATVKWYSSILGTFAQANAGFDLQEITTREIREYLAALRAQTTHFNGSQRQVKPGGLSVDTIAAHSRALHKFWHWCSDEYNFPNPMAKIRYLPKPKPKPKAVSPDDVAAMFVACGDDINGIRNRALLAFLWDTGCRSGGLIGLKVDHIDVDRHNALVTEKGGVTRAIVFTDFTAVLLEQWMSVRQPVPFLFYNLDTLHQLSASGLRGILKRMAKRAGVTGRVNPHAFRHGFAREYLDAGGDLSTLSRILGHSNVSTTLAHYVYFTSREIAEKHNRFSPVWRLAGGKIAQDTQTA